jgi:hypothetical protein
MMRSWSVTLLVTACRFGKEWKKNNHYGRSGLRMCSHSIEAHVVLYRLSGSAPQTRDILVTLSVPMTSA